MLGIVCHWGCREQGPGMEGDECRDGGLGMQGVGCREGGFEM